jgi:hypothetical protein
VQKAKKLIRYAIVAPLIVEALAVFLELSGLHQGYALGSAIAAAVFSNWSLDLAYDAYKLFSDDE